MTEMLNLMRFGDVPQGRLVQPLFKDLEAYRYENWLPDDGRKVCLNISGGRSSAYQAWHIVEANGFLHPRIICDFENTGREDPLTLAFIDKLDRELKLDVHWLEYLSHVPTKVKRVRFETAARNAEPFEDFLTEILPRRKDGTAGVRPLPNPVQRTCTSTLKIKTLHRFVRRHLAWGTDYYSVVGYRADERDRYTRRVKRDQRGWNEGGRGLFPMFLAGADDVDVAQFWMHAPFDLGIESAHGNCDYCFMLSTWKMKERMLIEAMQCQIKPAPGAAPPPKLAWWIAKEERGGDRGGTFRIDRPSFRQLWEQVCAGNMQSAVPENVADQCQSCTD